MMFKVKVAAVVIGATFLAGAAVPVGSRLIWAAEKAPVTAENGKLRREKDHKGREWQLENWNEGTAKFPAPEDPLKYREWASRWNCHTLNEKGDGNENQ